MHNRIGRWVLAVSAGLSIAFSACAGDQSIRAAHCLGVNETALAKAGPPSDVSRQWDEIEGTPGASERSYREMRDKVDRLSAYVSMTEIPGEKKAIEIARQRGRNDYQTYGEDVNACMHSCNGRSSSACFESCLNQSGAFNRSKACGRLDWLPF